MNKTELETKTNQSIPLQYEHKHAVIGTKKLLYN